MKNKFYLGELENEFKIFVAIFETSFCFGLSFHQEINAGVKLFSISFLKCLFDWVVERKETDDVLKFNFHPGLFFPPFYRKKPCRIKIM